ncbi:MAG: Flp pilus assembly complex ATPase component TadA [Gammaproteobacteria bacterium]|nr:Flp pilus assembly complex ATPase component TadA [Gammaproteobacteria bacterium]
MHSKSENSPIAKPFSPPLLCAPDDCNIVKPGDNVVVIGQDGTRINGKLHNAELTQEYLSVAVEGHKKPLRIDYKTTKLVSLHDFRRWVPFPQTSTEKDALHSPQELNFIIMFKDGDQLKGRTLGYSTDSNGFYLFPTQKPGYFIYTFIPHSAMANYQFGPKIGEQLLADKSVTAEHINSALVRQNEIRKKPIGEYLRDHALVTMKELEQALHNQKSISNIKLGELLLNEKLITQEQLDLALKIQEKDRTVRLGDILIRQGNLTTKQIHQGLARKLGIPYVDLNQIEVDIEALSRIPEKIARQYEILPLHIYNNKIVVVTNDPLDWKKLEAVRFSANMNVIPVMSSIEDIQLAINNNYSLDVLDDSVLDMDEYDEVEGEENLLVESSGDDNVIVRLANKIIIDAYNMHASDIHIEPHSGNKKTIIRMRKGGSLITYHAISPKLRRSLIIRLKVMADLDLAEKRIPQDGKINFRRFGPEKIELRVATIPTAGGEEDVVIRILGGGKPVAVDDLLLSKENLELAKYVLNNPYGLFFICGPTGSGKTTTLHSLLSHLNTPDRKIWTVEDPVEFTQEGIRQVQVQPKIGLDFASVLRSFLRADPDIIMVGEMRDEETASICINASLTGHLVLSTLHTNSAVESAVRLLEMGMDPFNFSDALLGILAQRLVKKLCPRCKKADVANKDEVDKLIREYCYDFKRVKAMESQESNSGALKEIWEKKYFNEEGKLTLYKTVGCKMCDQTGYLDRLGLHELLMASNQITLAISRRARIDELLMIALNEGMRTITQDGIKKILKGYTDLHQVRKYSIRL